jgi:hypothetical protein
MIPVRIIGPTGLYMPFGRALVDPGADDTVFPLDVTSFLGVHLLPATGHGMRWRGQAFPLRFGRVELEVTDDTGASLRWAATVAFSSAPLRYPLLGVCGCLEYLNAHFLREDRILELEPAPSCPLIGAMPC